MITPKDADWIGPIVATDFASLLDLKNFKQAKDAGMTDGQAFKYGDNGVGFTGLFTAQETEPMCALPLEVWREKWGSKHEAAGRRVEVFHNGISVYGILGDTMPSQAHITNGAGIDLNPAFLKFLCLKSPLKSGGFFWRWLE